VINDNKKTKKLKTKSVKFGGLQPINPHAVGIDIGAKSIFVCISTEDGRHVVREFLTFTADLRVAAEWLKECGAKTIAMESTGSYWIPVYDIFEEEGFEVNLINAHHLKAIPGKKTDVLDCQWIQTLHSYGLLRGSFRPDSDGVTFRAYVRHRSKLIELSSMQIQLMNKALIQMNIRLDQVFSGIAGASSIAIIRSIVAGERNSVILAEYRNANCKSTKQEVLKALEGNYRPEHIFALEQALCIYDCIQDLILTCDEKIKVILENWDTSQKEASQPMPLNSPIGEIKKNEKICKSKKKCTSKNSYKFDASEALKNVLKIDLTEIPGIEASTAIKIISEIGTDMSCWPTIKHFISWLSLCPGNKISGGKVLSSHTTPTSNKARQAFKLAANALHHSKSALGAFFRRMRSRLGAPGAIVAAAHKLAKIVYQMIKEEKEFHDIGQDAYEQQFKKRQLTNLKRMAADMGFDLHPRDKEVTVIA
jgi:hypothetical protein